jgi:CDP-glucose 4,6-dehydratase
VVGLRLRERKAPPATEGADAVETVYGDVRDLEFLRNLIERRRIDSCFHLAAQSLVGVANAAPLATFETNILGTGNVLEACRALGTVDRIVISSSDKAYGGQEQQAYREEMPLNPVWPYDASKACADIVARTYASAYGMPVAVTRMGNVYGGGDFNFSRIVPGTIRSALLGERPVIRSDGTPVRDYLYVEDAVAGYLALGERAPDPEVAGGAFNFGSGEPVSVLQLVQTILDATDSPAAEPQILGASRGTEADREFVDSGHAHAVLGWTPRIRLTEGVRRSVEWYRKHLDEIRQAA